MEKTKIINVFTDGNLLSGNKYLCYELDNHSTYCLLVPIGCLGVSEIEFWNNILSIAYLLRNPQYIYLEDPFTIKKIDLSVDFKTFIIKKKLKIDSILKSKQFSFVVDRIKRIESSTNVLYVDFLSIEKEFSYKINDDKFINWFYLLFKAFYTETEILVVINVESNEIIEINFPIESFDLENPEIKSRIIPKLIKPIKQISKSVSSNTKSFKNIEQIDLDWNSVTYIQFENEIRWYFCDTNSFGMTFWQSDFSKKDGIITKEFPEERVISYFKEYHVTAEDLKLTMRYLIDIEEWEKVKAFLPSFYFNYPKKEFISFWRPSDSFIRSVLPGWSAKHEPFFDLIPEEQRYWIIDGKDWSKEFFHDGYVWQKPQ